MLELCFDRFKTGVPGDPAPGARRRLFETHYEIHTRVQSKIIGKTVRLCGSMDGLKVASSLRLAGPPGTPDMQLSKQSSSMLFRARESVAGR